MANTVLTNKQEQDVLVSFLNGDGSVFVPTSAPVWASSNLDNLSVVQSEDGLSAVIRPSDNFTGTETVTVGGGGFPVVGTFTVEVTEGRVGTVTFTFGEIRNRV